ncbi:MAG: M36 family metallopeptidase [Lewinellaceae bacterium]|nr:M36 family metallopeptidase [Saprospiraceae bacterium]MCB9333162.1 M36 family metallopeptidase [Lewinellaceae bacterium]
MLRTFVPRLWLLAGALVCLAVSLQSQNTTAQQETALRFLQSNPTAFNLSRQDVSDVRITDAYRSKHNGVTHVWVQQQHAGIPVFNALFGLHVKPDGSVLHLGHRFVPNLAQQVNTTLPSLGAARALEIALHQLGFSADQMPALKRKVDERHWIFEKGSVSNSEIPVKICYDLNDKGQPRLAWSLYIDPVNNADLWTINVDAQTGQLLSQYNHTVYCQLGHPHLAGETCTETAAAPATPSPKSSAKLHQPEGSVDETYNVFALPLESPAHGARTLEVNPADPIASPYGWLDVNGMDGADFTYTRGNNVWAFDDSANDNSPLASESANGGPDLLFDFPFDPNVEPVDNLLAAITNLFYMNNKMHDITYRFGFDEEAGNFQTNNYGNGGDGNDAVLAQAIDGSGTDNANFSTPSDGSPGRMQMYVWGGSSGDIVKVNGPSQIAGTYYAVQANNWGGAISQTPVTGAGVVTNDGTGSNDATKNCTPPVNDLQGKIAIVDRGNCEFGRKALYAQQAGAVGCIICNYEDATVNMGPGVQGAQVTIPVVSMTKPNCDKLRQFAGNGLNISIGQPSNGGGPDQLDGDFDNGIISHEYGHGISNRLTGGPNASSCLSNGEQMGEGWSDFFSLIMTVKPGDFAEMRRGVGTYVQRQPNDGQGIRRFPYSTDMSINPQTYAAAQDSQQHNRGEIWAQVTWDLYWAMVEKYGYDPDLNNTSSGNFRAIQLVMDGMKLQPCRPGFVDGRDAIIAADVLNYDAVDTCLIVSVFARRGLGIHADQGSFNDAIDGTENFDPIPTCIKEIKISKTTSTPFIQAGDETMFTITITNHKDETATNVVVTDPLPAGLSFISADNGGTDNGGVVTWNLGDMPTGQVIELHYTAKSDPAMRSLLNFRDDMDVDDGTNWISLVNNDEGTNVFYLQSDSVKVGNMAWRADAPITETDQVLLHYNPALPVTGTTPVMRFWHNYNTEANADAGFLEIQRSGNNSWFRLEPDKVFGSGYNSVQYGTFAIPYLSGFSGNSNGWVRSYFDLSDFKGDNILFQFRFGTDDNTNVPNGGWVIDQVDLIDLFTYDSEACVTSDAGDIACANAPNRGVIVDTDATIGTDEPATNPLGLTVRPNPTTDWLNLGFGQSAEGQVQIRLISADGRTVLQQQANNVLAGQMMPINVKNLPSGMYVVQVESSLGNSVIKVVKR